MSLQPVPAILNESVRRILSPEARVLLLAVGATSDPVALRTALADGAFSWDRLLDLAVREKAAPALHELVGPLGDDLVTREARGKLGDLLRFTTFHMLRLEQLFLQALDILDEEGVDAVLLKGAGLATTVYASFNARPMYDIDLLVRPEHALRAWNALRANGWVHDETERPTAFYTTHYHLPPLDDPGGTGLALELHTSLADECIGLNPDMIRQNAREIQIHGRRALVPVVEHQVVHLATHFAWTHGLASAAWRTFRDLYKIASHTSIDWDRVVSVAKVAHATTSCYWTFRLAQSCAGVNVPDGVIESLKPPRIKAVLRVLERHYASMLFRDGRIQCPSVHITKMLWSAGMAPRWSGHGNARPWHRGEVWADARGAVLPDSALARMRGHVDRIAQWRRYVSALVR